MPGTESGRVPPRRCPPDPEGGVADRAEFGSVGRADDTALLASAGGAAAVVAAGLGFPAPRRRAAAVVAAGLGFTAPCRRAAGLGFTAPRRRTAADHG